MMTRMWIWKGAIVPQHLFVDFLRKSAAVWLTHKATCRWMAELSADDADADELESMAAELLSEDSDESTASSEAGDSAFDLDAMQAELEEGNDGEEEDGIRLELEDDAETEEEEREEREGDDSSSGEDEEEDEDGDGSVDDDLQALEAELLSGGGSPRPAEELIGGDYWRSQRLLEEAISAAAANPEAELQLRRNVIAEEDEEEEEEGEDWSAAKEPEPEPEPSKPAKLPKPRRKAAAQ